MSRRKLYRVVFTETRLMRIKLKARSAEDAIDAAEHLYLEQGDSNDRFHQFGGDAFHDADATEVQP